jgi:hypothetical protein
MENLAIKHKTHSVLRKILGVIAFVCGIVYLILIFETLKIIYILLAVFWILIGAAWFITADSSDSSTVKPGDGFITVRWINWIKSRIIHDAEIEKITLTKFHVLISRNEQKPLNLPVDFFEQDQKREVYAYFIELCKQRNYPLEKIGFGKEGL